MENEKNQKPFDEEAKREAENTQQNSSEEGKKMEIEITRYKAIVRAFNEPKKLAKLIIVIALIITLVFLGVTLIALVVKSYYPYKTVNSNEYGATVIENEDNEIIYWLFNSADLWANSGIKVKAGDVISVRTSGSFHSAIHHLVQDAENNTVLRDRWLDPTGGDHGVEKDQKRSEFRISKSAEYNTILMQVIPDNVVLKDSKGKVKDALSPYLDGLSYNGIQPDIYAIGPGREKIRIRQDGVLYFAVNDIVLSPKVIASINKDSIIKREMDLAPHPKVVECLDSMKKIMNYDESTVKYIEDSLKKHAIIDTSKFFSIIEGSKCGCQCKDEGKKKNYMKTLQEICVQTELDYYKENNFYDAWFVDNVGSFLIVIERKKQ